MQLLELLKKTAEQLENTGIDDALPDAEMLVLHAAATDRLAAYMNNPKVSLSLIKKVKGLVKRRLQGEPVQYIIGHVEFLGLTIHVGKGVLIPRPETELLVEEALKTIKNNSSIAHAAISRLSILDLCTGSGCIALALAKSLPGSEVIGADISKKALFYARKNAEANLIKNIRFLHGALLEPVSKMKFDVITANPPYIKKDEIKTLQREIREWEPLTALDGGEDGLDFYRTILAEAGDHLNRSGWIFLEIGYGQAEEVIKLSEASRFKNIKVINDYSGIGRILKAQYP